jgi:hypothetical protein
MTQDTNQPFPHQLEVVHAVPGRMRLRLIEETSDEILEREEVTEVSSKLDNLLEIAQYLKQQKGVESVKIKKTTNSIVVIFNSHTLSTSQLKEYLSPFKLSSTSPKSHTEAMEKNGAKLLSKLVSLIPILLSWFIVKRFNLSGWKAIVTYVLATGLIGEAIEVVHAELYPSKTDENCSETNQVEPNQYLSLNQEQDSDYKIVHYIPGRIRLSIPKVRKDQDYAQKVEQLLEQDERITAVRINSTTGSVVVHYLKEALGDISEPELALMLSNWFQFIDAAIMLDDSNSFTSTTQNQAEIEEQFSPEN